MNLKGRFSKLNKRALISLLILLVLSSNFSRELATLKSNRLLNPLLSFKFLPFSITAGLLFISYLVFKTSLPNIHSGMSSKFPFLSGTRFSMGRKLRKSREAKFALKNGGDLGGISNEGNTCFMNSVLQSLASSKHLLDYTDSYLYEEMEIVDKNSADTFRTKNTRPGLEFTKALKTLLDNVNGRYGTRGKEFSTKELLNKMPNGPKQNFFTGYNQEDAQEFYQLVMNLVEKEYKHAHNIPAKQNHNVEYYNINDLLDFKTGIDDLGSLGDIHVPASQVDPNLEEADHKVKKLELITPVDGISAERIGCLTCGEVSGIRYSVNSGLSLNLPNTANSYNNGFELEAMLNDWITPEIIEDVNCNRCGLEQTKQFLNEKIENSTNEKINQQFTARLEEIEQELAKHCVTDEAFEKLTIKQMIKKSRKSKQILLSRPPPLLAIHINRSVFDPRTYMVVKNSSKVSFPINLNLTPFVAVPDDINMDGRLPFRKQDEIKQLTTEQNFTEEKDHDSMETDEVSSPDTLDSNSNSATTQDTNFIGTETANPKLLYNLKAVISHYGTHNYGHYICYRKCRGTWWRISDESVYVSNEEEVLNSQGTFMMFYEFNDGQEENLIPLGPEEESEEEEEEEKASSLANVSHTTRPVSVNGSQQKPGFIVNSDEELYESSGLSDDDEEDQQDQGKRNDLDYKMAEERAFHM